MRETAEQNEENLIFVELMLENTLNIHVFYRSIRDLVSNLPRKEQIQLAMHILQNIADEESQKNEWLTDEVEAELLRRKEAALNGKVELKTFDAIKLDVKNFKFNRNEANM